MSENKKTSRFYGLVILEFEDPGQLYKLII